MISTKTLTLCGAPVVATVVPDLFPADRAYILVEPSPANYSNALLELGMRGCRDLGEPTPSPPDEQAVTEVAFRGCSG